MPDSPPDFTIERLGPCRFPSPMLGVRFVTDDDHVLYPGTTGELKRWTAQGMEPPSLEVAGPRRETFFEPGNVRCGIVSCGGLCPGINDVIRAIVISLRHHYGVRSVYGFRYGYEGLVKRCGHAPIELRASSVNAIHSVGGSILGSSRGPQDPVEMLETIKELGISILFAIGGDGTLRGARAIACEAERQGITLAVVGVPKTVDNDVQFVQKTFGFETAVAEARRAVSAANIEAESARNGIGLVKLMGRDSGFIAAYSVLVGGHVNFCLIPEVPFTLERFFEALAVRLEHRGHAVVVVAEGAGQDLMAQTGERDASGNVKFGDIGVFLRDAILGHFKQRAVPITLKYIDPSYSIRSVPATAHDSAFCLLLGHAAVHAGMTGRTNMVVGYWNHQFTHVPIALATSARKKIDPDGTLWSSVLASTGQPRELR